MKTVVVVDRDLAPGLALNAFFILGVSLGAQLDAPLGPDLPDADGVIHPGITSFPVPVLAASRTELAAIRVAAAQASPESLLVLDFSNVAQSSATYPFYATRLVETRTLDCEYRAVLLRGPTKLVGRLTGSLPLFR